MLRLLLLLVLVAGGYSLLRGMLGGVEDVLSETFRWMFP
jgi:hypothetical protein